MADSAARTQDHDVLITMKLKGRATAAAVADAIGCESADVLGALAQRGLVEPVRSSFKLTPAGAEAADRALAAVRTDIGATALPGLYAAFCDANGAFKETVTAWQLRTVDGVQVLNDHADQRYDAAVLARLRVIHDEISTLLGAFAPSVSRFGRYRDRLAASLARLVAGQREFMASPAVDSYHSVWFELHEELIQLCGLTRADEAAAGRG